ncbi:MAG TPA: efflux RND transporter periplasmic adaptor subunit [Bacteroidales bacterium]|nr:efflux RND transporter periplasmic adaptor subunit [Bacteroidales bacterium]
MKVKYFTLAVLILMAAMFFVSCGSESKAKTDKEKSEQDSERIRNVKVMQLSIEEVGRDIDYSANLIANEEVYLAPATPGRIIRVYPEVGDRVSAGQILLQMDPTQLNNAILQLSSLEKDMARFDTLIQYGGISKQQYDQMKTQVEVTRLNVDLLKTNTNLSAPFSGVITAKYFENGELFSGAPNTQAGKAAVVVLQQINPIKAVISVSEKYYPVVKKGMKVIVKSDIYPNKEFEGKISLIHPTINSATKTFNVEIMVTNNEELLRPGMYARVNLEFAKESAMVVPSSAVLQQMGTNNRYVFVYDNGKAKRIEVQMGKRFDDKVEIESELIQEGAVLIISGHAGLVDGAKVKIVE